MNEDEYRNIYNHINHQRCIFEKTTLLSFGDCEHKHKIFLAEREAMSCKSKLGQLNCQLLLNEMRKNARFVLQITNTDQPLPHSKELRVQVGGLYGLQQYLDHNSTTDTQALNDDALRFDHSSQPIKNIHEVISDAKEIFVDIKKFPYDEIVKAITHFNIRKRKKKRPT
jgi:hypothetical protein